MHSQSFHVHRWPPPAQKALVKLRVTTFADGREATYRRHSDLVVCFVQPGSA